MTDDSKKTKAELIAELNELREQLEQLEQNKHSDNGFQSYLDMLLRKTLETSHHVVYFFDVDDSCYQYISPILTSSDFPLKTFSDTISQIHPDDAEHYRATIDAAQSTENGGKTPFVIEYRRKVLDGTYHWFREYGSLLESLEGRYCLAGLAIDITEQKKREEQLSAQEQQFKDLSRQFKAILNAVPDNLTLQSPDYRIVWANRACIVNSGYSEEEVIGSVCYELWHDRSDPCQICPVQKSFETGKSQMEEATTPDGRVWELYAVPIHDDSGTVTAVVELGHDATVRRQLTESRLKKSKLESLGVLAGGIAHDFNNLLAGIQGNIGLAKMYLSPTHEAFEALDDAEQVSERAKRLTNQFLTFSRGGTPVKKPTDMISFLHQQSEEARENTGLEIEINLPGELPACDIDRNQVGQVFHNLFINAAEAMGRTGSVKINAQIEDIAEGTSLPLEPGKFVVISISDTGPGIPKENLGKVFDPYFTTKQMGHGLGLAVAFSVIRKHKGHIEVLSPPGGGAIFKLYFKAGTNPLTESYLAKHEHEHFETETFSGSSILFMDDDPVIRTTTGKLLASHGFSVDTTGDGETAVEYYVNQFNDGNPYDVVILDLMVQRGMGGKTALERIREVNPDVRAVVSSGYYNDPAMADFMAHGFLAKAEKPYRIGDLLKIINRVLSNS